MQNNRLAFYEAMDKEIGKLLQLSAIVGATADHGMNAKVKTGWTPNVLFVEDMLEEKFGDRLSELYVLSPILM